MFNLDLIEQDWKDNSFQLSEEEIIDIYKSEGVTLSSYQNELKMYEKNTGFDMSIEAQLMRRTFGEYINQDDKEIEPPKKKRLSKESQKRVVEGSLYIVFNSTREWYNILEGKVSMEQLYYICLEALFNSVKYMTHCEDPVFELYVLKSIEKNIIRHISKRMHITYGEANKIVKGIYDEEDFLCGKNIKGIYFDEKIKVDIEKPSKIFYYLRRESFDIDYIKDISSEEFLCDYNDALDVLDEDEKIVMQMSYDINGNHGMSYNDISDYMGIDSKKIYNIKKRAIKKLSKNEKLNSYVV